MDIIAQILVLLIPIIFINEKGSILVGWIALGVAQTISCGINKLLLNKRIRARGRNAYEIIIAIFVCGCIPYLFRFELYYIYQIIQAVQMILCVIIVASPVLAFWYGYMTITELIKIDKNENDIIL